MLITEEFHKLINPSFRSQTTLDNENQLPVFGESSETVADALYRRALKESGNPLLIRSFYSELCTFYAQVGAYAATVSSKKGKLYEVGCGLAVPSLAYARMTGLPTIAMDYSRSEIREAKKLAELLHTHHLSLRRGDGKKIMQKQFHIFPFPHYSPPEVGSLDTILVVNPVDDRMDTLIRKSNAKNVIYVGGSGKLFGQHEMYTSLISGISMWKEWFCKQGIDKELEAGGWNRIVISGQEGDFLRPQMALVHCSR